MKTINLEADRLYKEWKSAEVLAKQRKEKLMKFMAGLPEGHTSAFCSYVKPGKRFNTGNAALLAMSESLEIPTETVIKQDWATFQKSLKNRLDFDDLAEQYELYDEKKAYIRSEKKVA